MLGGLVVKLFINIDFLNIGQYLTVIVFEDRVVVPNLFVFHSQSSQLKVEKRRGFQRLSISEIAIPGFSISSVLLHWHYTLAFGMWLRKTYLQCGEKEFELTFGAEKSEISLFKIKKIRNVSSKKFREMGGAPFKISSFDKPVVILGKVFETLQRLKYLP